VPGCTGQVGNPLYVKATGDNGGTWTAPYEVLC
jgi:hypothetical protein